VSIHTPNLEPTEAVNGFGYKLARCTATYPGDSTEYPCTLNGTMLDEWCNAVDSAMHLLDEVTDLGANHPTGLAFNFGAIPSADQRAAFRLMWEMMQNVYSLAGTLRYDVCADHAECPEHDDAARRNVMRIVEHFKSFDPYNPPEKR
jgi:hypothetical protein